MNPELEEILKAYDAAVQARGEEASRLRAIYESRLSEILERRPGLSLQSLQLAVDLAYTRWKRRKPDIQRFRRMHNRELIGCALDAG